MKDLLAYFERVVEALRAGARPPGPGELLRGLDGLVEDVPPTPEPRPRGLRIGLVCREYPPDTAYGGMATFSHQLTRGLAEAGHRVTVVTAGGPRLEHPFGCVDVVRIAPRPSGGRVSFEEQMRRGELPFAPAVFLHGLGVVRQIEVLERARGRFDVLDLADHGADGLAPALFRRGPATVRLYSPYALLAAMRSGFAAEIDTPMFTALEGTLLRRCKAITAPSRDLAARVRTFFHLDRDVDFVGNPVDADFFRPAERRGAGTHAADDIVRVCFVGRLEQRKGILTLLQAIPSILQASPRVRFTIVGLDVLGAIPFFRRKLPPDRVEFVPPVSLADLVRVYQSADLAVVPSNYDNSPYTCVEPMSCGIPVVGTTVGGIPEYVVDGETGLLVPPRDPDALGGAILRLVADPGLRRRMGEAGRARVEQLFDYRRIAAETERVYRSVIAGDRAEPEAAAARESPWRPRPTFDRGRPERARLEILVRASKGDRTAVERTLGSFAEQGVESTVVWHGPDPPSFEGVRVVATDAAESEIASRLLSTVLADAFVVLRAAETVRGDFVARALCAIAATGRSTLVVDGVRIFLAASAPGLLLPLRGGWDAVLDYLAAVARESSEVSAAPPIVPWEPGWLAASATEPGLIRHTRALEGRLWSARLRWFRRAIRFALVRLPGGTTLAARASRRRLLELLPDSRAVRRSHTRFAAVGGDETSARRAAADIDSEVWALGELLPKPLWNHALCLLLRTRPPERLRIAPDVGLDRLPEDYRAALDEARSLARKGRSQMAIRAIARARGRTRGRSGKGRR